MSAPATLREVVNQLKLMHASDRRGLRDQMRQQREGIGGLTTTAVLRESVLDAIDHRVKAMVQGAGKVAKKAFSIGTLGIGPLVGKLRLFSKKARANQRIYRDRLESLVAEGRSPEEAESMANLAAEGTEGQVDVSIASATLRTANAVERIASSIERYLAGTRNLISGGGMHSIPAAGGSVPLAPDADAGGGDTQQAKSRNTLVRFARVSAKTFGRFYTAESKSTRAAAARNASRLSKVIMGSARAMIAGIASAIGTAFAAVAPFLPAIGAIAVSIAALIAIVKAWRDGNKIEEETRALEEEGFRKGQEALNRFDRKESIKDQTVGDILAGERSRVAEARESGSKIDLYLPGQGTFVNLNPDAADAMLDQSMRMAEEGGTLMATGRSLDDAKAMEGFKATREETLSRMADGGYGEEPMNMTEAAGFTDTEYFTNELSRLENLKSRGVQQAQTVEIGSSVFDPFSSDNIVPTDIDSAIAMTQQNLAQAKNLHIGMTRNQIRDRGLLDRTGPLAELIGKTPEQMRSERSSFTDFAVNEILKSPLSGPVANVVGYATTPSRDIGRRRDMSARAIAVPGTAADQMSNAEIERQREASGAMGQDDVSNAVINAPKVNNISNTTNVSSGHMTDSPASVKEMQHAG